ncbi:MAG: hypothetical protein AAFN10_25365 [Bacteroidota bacterium]
MRQELGIQGTENPMRSQPREAFCKAGKKQKIPDMLNPSHFGMTGKSGIKYHRNVATQNVASPERSVLRSRPQKQKLPTKLASWGFDT